MADLILQMPAEAHGRRAGPARGLGAGLGFGGRRGLAWRSRVGLTRLKRAIHRGYIASYHRVLDYGTPMV